MTSNGRGRKRRRLLIPPLIVLLVLAAAFGLSGCGKADISSYGDTPITITGLTDENFMITPNDLARLDCVSRTATGATAKAGTVNAYGPLLDTFLAQYDCKASDFSKIRFICSDGYKVVLRDEYLTDYEVVMAVSGGSEPLAEAQQPLRILIPDAESSMWAYAVTQIEFVRDEG